MKPGPTSGARSAALTMRCAMGMSSLGRVLTAATDRGVCAILLGDRDDLLLEELHSTFPGATIGDTDASVRRLLARSLSLVETPALGLVSTLDLDLRGTDFQRKVWETLRAVPGGETVTYAEIARRISAPDAARAVGRACAANTIAVAVPCHRAVRSDATLSGYRWGLERKRLLLKRESLATSGARAMEHSLGSATGLGDFA